MDIKLLIDAMVRQTTVLIANLSTAAGVRAPLAHIADQVFVELSREIESQGVSRKVAADMFGMALRTYQKRVQRLAESMAEKQKTLWQAVLDYTVEHAPTPRADILRRFRYETSSQVASVLNDLVSSGLISRTGRGDATVYTATDESEYEKFLKQSQDAMLRDLVRVQVYRNPKISLAELVEIVPFGEGEVEAVLLSLVADGRIEQVESGGVARFSAATLTVPVGSRKGWELAVFDHYQALCTAVARKVQAGAGSKHDDRIGGATLSFDVYPGHPYEQQAYDLLRRVRNDINLLWMAVSQYNEQNPLPEEGWQRVVFYFGQYVDEDLGPEDVDA